MGKNWSAKLINTYYTHVIVLQVMHKKMDIKRRIIISEIVLNGMFWIMQ